MKYVKILTPGPYHKDQVVETTKGVMKIYYFCETRKEANAAHGVYDYKPAEIAKIDQDNWRYWLILFPEVVA